MKTNIAVYILWLAVIIIMPYTVYFKARCNRIISVMTVRKNNEAKRILEGRFMKTYMILIAKVRLVSNIFISLTILITFIAIELYIKDIHAQYIWYDVIWLVGSAGIGFTVYKLGKVRKRIEDSNKHTEETCEILAKVVALGAKIGRAKSKELLTVNELTILKKECVDIYKLVDANNDRQRIIVSVEKTEDKLDRFIGIHYEN